MTATAPMNDYYYYGKIYLACVRICRDGFFPFVQKMMGCISKTDFLHMITYGSKGRITPRTIKYNNDKALEIVLHSK